MQQKKRTARSWVSMKANTQGHFLEGYIKGACDFYKDQRRAYVEQIPEPFRVTSTNRNGEFTGRFTANAQPDFMGVLPGGRAICFEAKYTGQEKLQQSVVTDTQADTLEHWWSIGAKAGVCINIGDVFAFIPWGIWRSMKAIYGRKYIKQEEAETFRVKFNGHVLFLDYVHPGTVANLEAQLWQQDKAVT